MKFSIITPTIGRSTLQKTIESIDSQSFKDLEHIIIYDGGDDFTFKELFNKYNNNNRKVINSIEKKGDFANYNRGYACDFASGEYITYIDDDDWYINDTFAKLNDALNLYNSIGKDPTFVFYPCLRLGQRFLNLPPARCMTVSCQYIHKRIKDGHPIKFASHLNGQVGGYIADGEWIETMANTYDYMVYDNECLVQVDFVSGGQVF
jgi:glycosyltransferase involved in cell wall biosynthesis